MKSSTLGQRIAAKRNDLGLSQSALGEQLGVSRQSVFKWESDAAIPEIDKLIALSRLFGVTLDWLVGIGEGAPAKEEPPRDFTDRERRILEQLSHQKPSVPRWMKVLTGIAVSCAAVAMIGACVSLHQSARALERAEEVISYVRSQLIPQEQVVRDFTCECTPSANLDSAAALLRITPYYYEESHRAAVLALLGEEVVALSDCRWNGVSWESELELKPANGYRILFRIIDESGNEFTQELNGTVLNNLGHNLAWPTDYSVTWKTLDAQRTSLTFTELSIQIPLPGVYRDHRDLWERCDLVLTDDAGEELCRFDLMHRSQYSAAGNFGLSDVNFTTQTVALAFPEPGVGTELYLNLECALTDGHQFFCPVDTWLVTDTGITNQFIQSRE